MKHLSQPDRWHQLLLANMALGLILFAAAVYMMIAGEYANLLERQTQEALLNKLALGGLLYGTLAWYVDRFFRPHFHTQ